MKLWEKIEPYFRFTKGEKRGIYVLLGLMMLALVAKWTMPFMRKEKKSALVSVGYLELEVKTKKQEESKNRFRKRKEKSNEGFLKEAGDKKAVPHPFDPNKASYNELFNTGFSKYISRNIINYRDAGGIFSSKEDMYKIYGMNEKTKELIDEYCRIDTTELQRKLAVRKNVDRNIKIDINKGDSLVLMKLPGIGKYLSKRIIKYRDMLGGYTDRKQLQEVYGLQRETYDRIKEQIIIDTSRIIRININQATEKELCRHPYLTNYQARAITKYKELMGPFKRIEQIKENYLLTEEEYLRIYIYLSLN